VMCNRLTSRSPLNNSGAPTECVGVNRQADPDRERRGENHGDIEIKFSAV
jgi:hypothetical protein